MNTMTAISYHKLQKLKQLLPNARLGNGTIAIYALNLFVIDIMSTFFIFIFTRFQKDIYEVETETDPSQEEIEELYWRGIVFEATIMALCLIYFV